MATIALNLLKLSAHIEDAYTALSSKGVDLTGKTHNATNLSACIDSIESGGGSAYGVSNADYWGDVNSNGQYRRSTTDLHYDFSGIKSFYLFYGMSGRLGTKVMLKARNIDVSFPDLTSVSMYALQNFGRDNIEITAVSFPKLKGIDGYGMSYAFNGCTNILSVEFPELTGIVAYSFQYAFGSCSNIREAKLDNLLVCGNGSGLTYAFTNCTSLSSISLQRLSSLAGSRNLYSMCYGCTKLSSLELPSVTRVGTMDCANIAYGCTQLRDFEMASLSGSIANSSSQFTYAFYNCSNLSSVRFPNLQSLTGALFFSTSFYNCTKLTCITFPSVTSIVGGTSYSLATFYNNNKLQEIYFPKLSSITNNYVFYTNCTLLKSLHFNIDYKEQIEATTGYASLWGLGAGKATVYWDRFDENGNVIDEDGNIIKELR